MTLEALHQDISRDPSTAPSTTTPTTPALCEANDFDCRRVKYYLEEFGAHITTIIGIVLVIILLAIFCGFGACVYFRLDDRRWERRMSFWTNQDRAFRGYNNRSRRFEEEVANTSRHDSRIRQSDSMDDCDPTVAGKIFCVSLTLLQVQYLLAHTYKFRRF